MGFKGLERHDTPKIIKPCKTSVLYNVFKETGVDSLGGVQVGRVNACGKLRERD